MSKAIVDQMNENRKKEPNWRAASHQTYAPITRKLTKHPNSRAAKAVGCPLCASREWFLSETCFVCCEAPRRSGRVYSASLMAAAHFVRPKRGRRSEFAMPQEAAKPSWPSPRKRER